VKAVNYDAKTGDRIGLIFEGNEFVYEVENTYPNHVEMVDIESSEEVSPTYEELKKDNAYFVKQDGVYLPILEGQSAEVAA
jgi:hypothetical protein